MSIINKITIQFAQPWLLLLLIPVIIFPIFLFLRIKKQHRNNRYYISSLVFRLIVLIIAVFLVSGMTFQSERISVRKDIIILVDVSGSTNLSTERMNSQIQSIIEESEGDFNIGIITFANGNIYNVNMTDDISNIYERYINSNSRPDASATNISVALNYANSQLSNPSSGRIILLTDGLETDGNALTTVREIEKSGVRIDTIYFSPNSHYNELQINSVNVPERVSVGETVQLEVNVQSTVAGSGVLSIYDNQTLVYQDVIMMHGYAEVFSTDYVFNAGGLHELYFEIESEFDTVPENNSAYAYVNINSSSNILIIEGKEDESALLVDLLGSDHVVTVVGTDNVPTTTTALQIFDEVILMNVANDDLSDSFVQLLDIYVSQLGGGLLSIGGDKAYVEDDMTGTAFEAMLPVLTSSTARPLAVMYVLDSSGSMRDLIEGTGKTRFELAKDGAIESVNALADRDYFGLVTFNSVANVAIPMTPASQRESIIEAINLEQTASGTEYKEGLELAASALKTLSDTYMKHIIFITDGTATDSREGYTEVVEGLADFNITLSGIAIYRGDFFTSHIVEELADIGGGRYYYVQDATELPSIMLTESTASAIEYVNEGLFVPNISSYTSTVAGITELPELGGYYGTLLKENATMVLSSNEGLPVYASWDYGSGRVGSFTSDLNGYWSSSYFTDLQGNKLLKNMVSGLFPEKSMEEKIFETEFINDNYTSSVRIMAEIEDGETLSARVTDPSGNTSTIILRDVTETEFLGKFTTDRPGIYTVAITKKNSSDNVISESYEYTAFSYSNEYDVFIDSNAGFDLIEQIAETGNGKLLYVTDGVFTDEAQVMTDSFNPRYIFLSLMILFFILDIFARKFKFKWPHELIKDYRTKNSTI